MSKSTRKPYTYMCGNGGLKKDREIASRANRRNQNEYLRRYPFATDPDCESFLIPDKYEAAHNNRYSWNCDSSRAHYVSPRLSPMTTTAAGVYAATGGRLDHSNWRFISGEEDYKEVVSGEPCDEYLLVRRK